VAAGDRGGIQRGQQHVCRLPGVAQDPRFEGRDVVLMDSWQKFR
jgi:hypothetical protein